MPHSERINKSFVTTKMKLLNLMLLISSVTTLVTGDLIAFNRYVNNSKRHVTKRTNKSNYADYLRLQMIIDNLDKGNVSVAQKLIQEKSKGMTKNKRQKIPPPSTKRVKMYAAIQQNDSWNGLQLIVMHLKQKILQFKAVHCMKFWTNMIPECLIWKNVRFYLSHPAKPQVWT